MYLAASGGTSILIFARSATREAGSRPPQLVYLLEPEVEKRAGSGYVHARNPHERAFEGRVVGPCAFFAGVALLFRRLDIIENLFCARVGGKLFYALLYEL